MDVVASNYMLVFSLGRLSLTLTLVYIINKGKLGVLL